MFTKESRRKEKGRKEKNGGKQMSDQKEERRLAERFTRDADKLLHYKTKEAFAGVDEEYGHLLKLSEMMLNVDWSKDRPGREILKKRLEKQLFPEEIAEDELDWVAGGLHGPEYNGVKEEKE